MTNEICAEKNGQFRRHRHRWEDNLREIRWEGISDSRRGPLMGFCEHGKESSVSIKRREFLD